MSGKCKLNGGLPDVGVMETPRCDHELNGLWQVGHLLFSIYRPIRPHAEVGVAANKAHLSVALAVFKLHCRKGKGGEAGAELKHSEIYCTKSSQIFDKTGLLEINPHPSRRILKYLIPSAVTSDSLLWCLWQNKLLIYSWTGGHGEEPKAFSFFIPNWKPMST